MKQQILIVEDNELNREMLFEILSDKYEITEAENGQEALNILEEKGEQIILILLDVMMPVMDGYTFLKKMKSREEFSHIPVIVTTQGDSEADEIAALEHGANDFVRKPYRPQVIRHRVASLINLRESAAMVNQFQYDRLTGLYTKEFFYRKVRECLDGNPDTEYTLLCCNLENFKLYNDMFGRQAGDSVLVEEARILRNRVGKDAICCHYSADRFLCLIEKETEALGRKCFIEARKKNRSELTENIPVKLGIYEITDRSIEVAQMCDRALWVVDTIKGIYDRHIAVYNDTLRNKLLQDQLITDMMETALKEKQFVIYFQPKYSLQEDCIVGAEALVRWIHPQKGFMSPGEFIPLFEKNGFIRQLDVYVWESVCKKLQEWKEKGYPLIPVSVNVSRADMYQVHLVDTLCNMVQAYNVDPYFLHLEITESAYTENPDQIINTVEELRKNGFLIEMDDFGSGYSSLNMLGQMSVDILKLDMQFIRSEMAKPVEQSLLSDVINMAHRMHLDVVAEGVETRDQRKRLKAMECDIAQGYFFSKPLPCEKFETLLQMEKSCKLNTDVQRKERISSLLIIEEDENYLSEIETQFHGMYHVRKASDAGHAVSLLKEYGLEEFSAIILSVSLSDNGSIDFLNQMRQIPVFWKTPVIGMVSSPNPKKEYLQSLDLDALFYKGFPISELQRRLDRLMDIVSFQKRENVLVDKANEDFLTGLLNRRGLQEALFSVKRDELPMAVCVFDLDHMKEINDMEGYERGDTIIKQFAELLSLQTRKTDIRCRYGGDKFVVLLKEVKAIQGAIDKCSDICRLFRETMENIQLNVTCSCGVSICTIDSAPSSMLLNRAEQALLCAKKENRGECCLWNEAYQI